MDAQARFHLDEVQLGAALALAGVRPGPGSRLPDLPPPSRPLTSLAGTPLLTTDGRQLAREAEAALGIAATPARVFSITEPANGAAPGAETSVSHSGGTGPYALLRSAGGGYALSLAPGVSEAAQGVVELLGLADVSAPESAPAVMLDVPAYTALLAAADALQAARLRARLARQADWKPVLTPEVLERELDRGLSGEDTRWLVTAAGRVSPVDLHAATGRMGDGMSALQVAGFLRPVIRGLGISETGERLFNSLADGVQTVDLALTGATPGGKSLTRVTMFHGAGALWIAEWSEATARGATLRWSQASAAGAVEVIRRLLQSEAVPVAPPASADKLPQVERERKRQAVRCGNPACRASLRPGAKFCKKCGYPVATSAVETPAERRCPECGRLAPADGKFCQGCGHPLPKGGAS